MRKVLFIRLTTAGIIIILIGMAVRFITSNMLESKLLHEPVLDLGNIIMLVGGLVIAVPSLFLVGILAPRVNTQPPKGKTAP